MDQGLLQIRKLTVDDFNLVQHMQTNIEDDYIITVFPDLVQSETNAVYGLFKESNLLAIAGSSIFPGGYAMLGRLRSDHRYLSKGHATEILVYIKSELEKDPSVVWVGANTNVGNKPARRVLEKLGLNQVTKLHSLPVINKSLINGKEGDIWHRVESLAEKRILLDSMEENALGIYPYECYYPFPMIQQLLPDNHLNESTFYQNPAKDRFLVIKNDQKHEWFAQVKYFWNDHFEQAGFWSTVFSHIEQDPQNARAWVELSEEGYKNIPNLDAFQLSDAWILYGKWVR